METLEELTVDFGLVQSASQADQPSSIPAVAQAPPSNLIGLQHSRLIQRQIQAQPPTPFTFQNCNVTINYNYQK